MKLKSLLREIQEFDIDKFTWNKKTGVFSTEISDLNNKNFGDAIYIKNKKTGNKTLFVYKNVDWNGSGDDREIAGWWYYAKKQPRLKLLIIND